MDRTSMKELTLGERKRALDEGVLDSDGYVPRAWFDEILIETIRKAKGIAQGVKYDQEKPRPSLIPAEVYRALVGYPANPTPVNLSGFPEILDHVAIGLAGRHWLLALTAVQDLLCPLPHRDSTLHGLGQIVQVLEFGAKKYGRDNWQGVAPERYVEAAWRHLLAFSNGETYDPESGLPHLAHLGCCLVFLVWFDVAT